MEVLSCVKRVIPNHSTAMMKIEILAVSGQKTEQFQSLCNEYLKRLKPFAKIEIRTLKSLPFRSKAQFEQIRVQESRLLESATRTDTKRILLTERGRLFTSEQFAKQLLTWSEHGAQPITFLIAGPLGPSPSLEQTAHECLSLSPLTFPHELAQTILLEQIYRAMTILKGKSYHY